MCPFFQDDGAHFFLVLLVFAEIKLKQQLVDQLEKTQNDSIMNIITARDFNLSQIVEVVISGCVLRTWDTINWMLDDKQRTWPQSVEELKDKEANRAYWVLF